MTRLPSGWTGSPPGAHGCVHASVWCYPRHISLQVFPDGHTSLELVRCVDERHSFAIRLTERDGALRTAGRVIVTSYAAMVDVIRAAHPGMDVPTVAEIELAIAWCRDAFAAQGADEHVQEAS
jgi:hypothetical protein